jgi:micrococcal nuclease
MNVLQSLATLGVLVGLVTAVGAFGVVLYQRLRGRPTAAAAKVTGAGVLLLVVSFVVGVIATPLDEPAAKRDGQRAEQAQEKPKPEPKPEPKSESRGAREAPESLPKAQEPLPEPRSGLFVTVTRVVDGDTIEIAPAVRGATDVRLIGVDTPEVYGGEEKCGGEASDFTARHLEGERVRLELDEDPFDPYGRLLAYVWLDGQMFNETLLESGLARQVTYQPNDKYEVDLMLAEGMAKTPSCASPMASATATATATAAATAGPAADGDPNRNYGAPSPASPAPGGGGGCESGIPAPYPNHPKDGDDDGCIYE